MLRACASWVAAVADVGNEAAHSYFGPFDLKGAAEADFPAAQIVSESHAPRRYAAGAGGLPGGTIRITIHALLGIEALDTLARSVADELTAQQVGLANLEASTNICSDPTPSDRAAGKHIRSIDIDCSWGLQP